MNIDLNWECLAPLQYSDDEWGAYAQQAPFMDALALGAADRVNLDARVPANERMGQRALLVAQDSSFLMSEFDASRHGLTIDLIDPAYSLDAYVNDYDYEWE